VIISLLDSFPTTPWCDCVFHDMLYRAAQGHTTHIYKVRAHIGVKGNEIADAAAKIAATPTRRDGAMARAAASHLRAAISPASREASLVTFCLRSYSQIY
jgi:hypothetical protein